MLALVRAAGVPWPAVAAERECQSGANFPARHNLHA